MLALLADGPLGDREITLEEPRPTIELAQDPSGPGPPARRAHRYRLAGVELVALANEPRRLRRIAVYVHAPHASRPTGARYAVAQAA